ncbi:MAG: DUF2283 domain-containing protein [Actinomycetota bacterium]|nr:DUF2283 domain-containing protein [Actinomycetota bacterium]
MAVYTYDEEADALYISLVPQTELQVDRTIALSERLHVDVEPNGRPVGIEILYPSLGPVDLGELRAKYALDVKIPFTFAA